MKTYILKLGAGIRLYYQGYGTLYGSRCDKTYNELRGEHLTETPSSAFPSSSWFETCSWFSSTLTAKWRLRRRASWVALLWSLWWWLSSRSRTIESRSFSSKLPRRMSSSTTTSTMEDISVSTTSINIGHSARVLRKFCKPLSDKHGMWGLLHRSDSTFSSSVTHLAVSSHSSRAPSRWTSSSSSTKPLGLPHDITTVGHRVYECLKEPIKKHVVVTSLIIPPLLPRIAVIERARTRKQICLGSSVSPRAVSGIGEVPNSTISGKNLWGGEMGKHGYSANLEQCCAPNGEAI